MKIKKATLKDEFNKMTLEKLREEEARLRSLLHEQLDLILDGMGDAKGYKNQPHLTVKKDMEVNWNIYKNCRGVLAEKLTRERIWNDDGEGIKVITQQEWDKLIEEGKAINYKTDKKRRREK